jgi:hypothetical protein
VPVDFGQKKAKATKTKLPALAASDFSGLGNLRFFLFPSWMG